MVHPKKVETRKSIKVETSWRAGTSLQPAESKVAEREAPKPELVVVQPENLDRALSDDPIPEADEKRAFELVHYSITCPHRDIIRGKLSRLDPRAVAAAVRKARGQGDLSVYQTGKLTSYDLRAMRLASQVLRDVPMDAIPVAAQALLPEHIKGN